MTAQVETEQIKEGDEDQGKRERWRGERRTGRREDRDGDGTERRGEARDRQGPRWREAETAGRDRGGER